MTHDSNPNGTFPDMSNAQARQTLKRLLKYPLRFRSALIWFFVFVILAVVCNVLGPRILGFATTRIFTNVMAIADGTGSGIDLDYIAEIAGVLLCLYGAGYFFQYMQGRLMTRITNRSTYHIRQDISKKLNTLPLSYFSEHSHAEVLSNITNDADVIAVTFNQVMTQTINSALTLIGITVVMFTMNALLAWIVLLLLPGTVFVAYIVSHKSQKYFGLLQQRTRMLTVQAASYYQEHGMRVCPKEVVDAFETENDRVCEAAWKSQFLSGIMLPITNMMSALAYILIAVLGGFLVIRGRLTIGEMQAFIQYVRSFSQPLIQLSWISSSIQNLLAAAQHIFLLLDTEEQEPAQGDSAESRDVVFASVGVTHADGTKALKDISFQVPQGTLVAITGPEGSGKTTLMGLLLHLYEPQEGRIEIGGKDLKDHSPQANAKLFGAALQQPWLQSATIAENIAYGRPDATRAQIEAAAKRVGADDFISVFPGGYDAMIQECLVNLSRGQIQLLQAARLELSDPDILVLDDPFDAVDALTYRKLQKQFLEEHRGKTKFVVTSNIWELEIADTVVVLQGGRITGVGPHSDLMITNRMYAAFIGMQQKDVDEHFQE